MRLLSIQAYLDKRMVIFLKNNNNSYFVENSVRGSKNIPG